MAGVSTVEIDLTHLPPELQDLVLLERELCARSLHEFIRAGWGVIEPGTPFLDNWHIGAIAEHLEAVSNDEIDQLLINVPPRTMKSIECSVMWPVWDWIAHPHRRFLSASYAQVLAIRDAVKARRIIQSPWYQERWGDRFYLTSDQNAKERYENNHSGQRLATAVDALATGEGGDVQIIDDPHNVKQAESDAVRSSTLMWLTEVMGTRFNNMKHRRRVTIMQRVHENDVAGHIIASESGCVHLCLPMRFERSRLFRVNPDGTPNREYVPPTPLGFEDPRSEEGELLWPAGFPASNLDDLERGMGPYAVAAQHQQRPTPRGGGMVKREDLNFIDDVPKDVKLTTILRSWDYAATDPDKNRDYNNPDWTAGVLIGKTSGPDPDVYIMDVDRFRRDPGERDERVIEVARDVDGRRVSVEVEEEPGSSGKSVIYYLRQRLPGYSVNAPRVDPMPKTAGQKKRKPQRAGAPTGNKVQRFETFATHCHRGKVYVLRRDWTADYVQEITTFPLSTKKDQCDATSQGFNRLMENLQSVTTVMATSNYTGY